MQYQFKAFMLISALACGLVVLGCDQNDQPAAADPPSTEDLIIADAAAARDALEAYAVEHDGIYPRYYSAVETLLAGLDLRNRYAGTPALICGDALGAGEIGVFLYSNVEAADVVGYRISAMGRDGLLTSFENTSRLTEESVAFYETMRLYRAMIVAAAEAFRDETGHYPEYTADTTPGGLTMVDLLPDGQLLVNPIDGKQDSPVDGAAARLGQLGYTATGSSCEWVSFVVDMGTPNLDFCYQVLPSADSNRILYQASETKCAIEAFHGKGGRYPADVDTDVDNEGKTIRDRMTWATNVYTGAALPSNGPTTTRGDIGYEPIYDGATIVGYTVNAWGLFEELEHRVVTP